MTQRRKPEPAPQRPTSGGGVWAKALYDDTNQYRYDIDYGPWGHHQYLKALTGATGTVAVETGASGVGTPTGGPISVSAPNADQMVDAWTVYTFITAPSTTTSFIRRYSWTVANTLPDWKLWENYGVEASASGTTAITLTTNESTFNGFKLEAEAVLNGRNGKQGPYQRAGLFHPGDQTPQANLGLETPDGGPLDVSFAFYSLNLAIDYHTWDWDTFTSF